MILIWVKNTEAALVRSKNTASIQTHVCNLSAWNSFRLDERENGLITCTYTITENTQVHFEIDNFQTHVIYNMQRPMSQLQKTEPHDEQQTAEG